MNLQDCFDLAYLNRPKWREGKGLKTLRTNVNHCLRILGGDFDIAKIKPSTFTKLGLQILRKAGKPATANRIMAALHAALTEAALEDEIKSVPSYRRFPEPPAVRDHYEKDRLAEVLKRV